MSKEYLVVVMERIRTTYVVPAKNEEEARAKIENREPNDGIEMIQEEYYDQDYVESVEENI